MESGFAACVGRSRAGEAAGDEVKFLLLGVVGSDVPVDFDLGEPSRIDSDRVLVDIAVSGGLDLLGIVFGDCMGEAPNAAEEFAVSEHCCRLFK